MTNNCHGDASLFLKNYSLHLNMSFLANRTQRKALNFNMIDTVVIRYLVVCKSTHDNKILKFGADKICREFWQSKTSFQCQPSV